MIDCVNHCYAFLSILFNTEASNSLIDMLKQKDQVPQWNDPEMPAELIEAAKHLPGILEHLNRASAS